MILTALAILIPLVALESNMPTHTANPRDAQLLKLAAPAAPVETPPETETTITSTFEAGQLARLVRMGRDGVELYDRDVIEDDGPGAMAWGVWWDTPKGIIRGPLQARKVLHLERSASRRVHLALLVWPLEHETEPLEVTFNGDAATTATLRVGEPTANGWRPVELPAEAVRAGDNQVLLTCRGDFGWGVGVAQREDIVRNDPDRQSAPARSFASADGGRTWIEGITAPEELPGEFMIRMTLDRFAAEGVLIGPVIDLAAEDGAEPVIAPPTRSDAARLALEADTPAGTAVRLALRSGPGPVVDGGWDDWRPADSEGMVRGPLNRFVQWRAVLMTNEPTTTPVVKAVRVEADANRRLAPWTRAIKVRSAHNEVIRYTSIPFEYERFDEPELKALREKYKLDEVVAGATTELEKMRKLQNWVSQQWTYDPPEPPYPAWDAHEILQRRQGFCVQYAIVYMQCALSLGMQTRFVFGMFPNARLKGEHICGHEVNEYWSNEYGKWVAVDAHQNELFLDAATGVPKSMLELREELLRLYSPDSPLGFEPLDIEELKASPDLLVWKGDEAAPADEPPRLAVKWGCVHWMPRNNMYARRYPEPMAQGRTAWSWTGYWHWDDGLTPRHWQWSNYTGRQSDLDWTLNQVRWAAEAGETPGEVLLRLGTVTPDFDTFLARIDDGPWAPAADRFSWTLQEGTNRIELRIRNRAGVLGVVSHIELDYTP